MKIHLISDLHLEYLPSLEHTVPEGTDVVVAAGDIGTGKIGINWLLETFPDLPVVYVAGNHEFYGQNWKIEKHYDTLHEMAEGTNVFFLQDEYVEIGGARFFGATMWTDYELYGNSTGAMEVAKQGYERLVKDVKTGEWKKIKLTGMNDYSFIKTGQSGGVKRKLTPQWVRNAHQVSRVNMDEMLREEFDGPTIIVTHHAPSEQSLMEDKREKKDVFNPCYATNFENYIAYNDADIALWLHGHVHEAHDYMIHETRVVVNPKGYWHQEERKQEKTNFNPELLLEI